MLVTCGDMRERMACAQILRGRFGRAAVRSGQHTVLVESARPDAALVEAVVQALAAGDPSADEGLGEARAVRIQARYDGPDLAECAAALEMSPAALVSAHQQQDWVVAMVGFAPGFGYLIPEGESVVDWSALPRRASPRPAVPAGAVAVAAGMSAVYPSQMPGGWNLIGSTDQVLFDPSNEDDPALLREGDHVRFRT